MELVEQINIFREKEYRNKRNLSKLTNAEIKRGHYVELLHKSLLEIIRDEFDEEIDEQKIFPVDYKDNKGELRPMYILTLDQSKQLLMRESKFVRKATISYINKLEEQLKLNKPQMPTTYLEALKQLVAIEEERQKLLLENKQQEQIINELKPKATYTDVVLNSPSLVSVTQIAKDFGLTSQQLNNILSEEKIQYKQGKQWLLYAEYSIMGYTQSSTIEKSGFTFLYTKWTQKGRLFIYDLLKKRGILPIVEII